MRCAFSLAAHGIDIWRIEAPGETVGERARHARDELLRRYLGLDPDAALEIARTRRGKPYLAKPHPPVSFNLSHTRGLALLAFIDQGALGIDVERIRPLRDPLRLAARVWPDAAVTALEAEPPATRLPAFFAGWTRFEAGQKALGSGVFDPPVDPGTLSLYGFAPAAGYVACLAVARDRQTDLRYFDYRPQ